MTNAALKGKPDAGDPRVASAPSRRGSRLDRKTVLGACALAAALALGADPVTVTFGNEASGHAVPKTLWGIFYEDINWAADGGLNPEMLANGGFDWQQADRQDWEQKNDGWVYDFRDGGMARISIQMGNPVHPNTARHVRIEAFGTGLAGIRNRGLDGMWIRPGETYRLSYDRREVKVDGIDYALGAWTRVTKTFTATDAKRYDFGEAVVEVEPAPVDKPVRAERSVPCRASLSLLVSGRRAVEFDNVSLQPTGPNLVRAGLRKDLVDALAELKPAFMRFPGGCIVEEGDFQHWYDWRRTVGPKERRSCVWNRWGSPEQPYWETFGVGFYEYFRLCEEIGAEPVPVCLCGLTCQFQKPLSACAVADVGVFTQAALDLIEFANGDVTTTWGRVRAEMGHPKPFNLKMIALGNENWDRVFWDRFEPIAKELRAKHPEIRLLGSAGPGPSGRNFDYAWTRADRSVTPLLDEHFYQSPQWFFSSAHRYDTYDRVNKPGVFAGEYACHWRIGERKPNILGSAIAEAVAMTGYERNSDVVQMASYAPLFCHSRHSQWTPNLIWFDGLRSWLTPNYYVQQMFSRNRPDRTVSVTVSDEKELAVTAGLRGGRMIAKFVNTNENETKAVRANLKGRAKITRICGKFLDDNLNERENVRPTSFETTLDGTLTLPTCSLTVVEML